MRRGLMGPWSFEKGPGPVFDFEDRLRDMSGAAGAEIVEMFRDISEGFTGEWL